MADATCSATARQAGLSQIVRGIPPRDTSPMTRETLSALLDLGMSNAAIARYFRLEERHIAMLRRAYCV